jgi:hypothetical protein
MVPAISHLMSYIFSRCSLPNPIDPNQHILIHCFSIMQQEQPGSTATVEVDFTQYPNARKLLSRCQDFFAEVENL